MLTALELSTKAGTLRSKATEALLLTAAHTVLTALELSTEARTLRSKATEALLLTATHAVTRTLELSTEAGTLRSEAGAGNLHVGAAELIPTGSLHAATSTHSATGVGLTHSLASLLRVEGSHALHPDVEAELVVTTARTLSTLVTTLSTALAAVLRALLPLHTAGTLRALSGGGSRSGLTLELDGGLHGGGSLRGGGGSRSLLRNRSGSRGRGGGRSGLLSEHGQSREQRDEE